MNQLVITRLMDLFDIINNETNISTTYKSGFYIDEQDIINKLSHIWSGLTPEIKSKIALAFVGAYLDESGNQIEYSKFSELRRSSVTKPLGRIIEPIFNNKKPHIMYNYMSGKFYLSNKTNIYNKHCWHFKPIYIDSVKQTIKFLRQLNIKQYTNLFDFLKQNITYNEQMQTIDIDGGKRDD